MARGDSLCNSKLARAKRCKRASERLADFRVVPSQAQAQAADCKSGYDADGPEWKFDLLPIFTTGLVYQHMCKFVELPEGVRSGEELLELVSRNMALPPVMRVVGRERGPQSRQKR